MAENSSIIVCDQAFDVGRRVITWKDDPSISAYTPHCVTIPGRVAATHPAKGIGEAAMRYRGRRLMGADRSLSRLKQVLRQFVVHHDGMGTSRDCFRVLHDERGLSVHFLLDNNGDIYQTLDLVECGFQAAGVNEISIGVELCSRGDHLDLTTHELVEEYRKNPREKKTCTINGHQWLSWDYTKAQMESMVALGRALARIFPGLPQVSPTDGSGEPIWSTLAGDPREFAGYLGHYHVTDQKWDPGPWDFKQFIQQIRGRTFYPWVPGAASAEVPEDEARVEPLAQALYDNNEGEAEGGFFPVGPIGQSRLWHDGLHLRADRGTPLVAPFSGKIVAARRRREDDWPAIGSSNFVLIRHDLPVAGAQVKFFTLYFHTDDEGDEAKRPAWMQKRWGELDTGEVVTFDEPVAAGELVAHFGEAGAPGNHVGQIHFEIFSDEEIGEKIEPGYWKTYDGTKILDPKAGPRFCAVPEIIGPIDADKNRYLAGKEIQAFFKTSPARGEFHRLAVRHVSEWGDKNDWERALDAAPDFARLPRPKKHELFESQIASTLWWGDDLGKLGLPDDKVIWTYHPVTFVTWMAGKLHGPAQKAKGVESEAAWNGKAPPDHIKDDASDGADGFVDDEDALFGAASKSLDLEALSAGYPDKK